MNLDNTSNSKKLGIYISFKASEKQLYNNVKLIPNYSTVIKELLLNYLENEKCTQYKQSKYEKSMLVTIDDLCRLISSVNSTTKELSLQTVEENKYGIMQQVNNVSKESLIPEDMLKGL